MAMLARKRALKGRTWTMFRFSGSGTPEIDSVSKGGAAEKRDIVQVLASSAIFRAKAAAGRTSGRPLTTPCDAVASWVVASAGTSCGGDGGGAARAAAAQGAAAGAPATSTWPTPQVGQT